MTDDLKKLMKQEAKSYDEPFYFVEGAKWMHAACQEEIEAACWRGRLNAFTEIKAEEGKK